MNARAVALAAAAGIAAMGVSACSGSSEPPSISNLSFTGETLRVGDTGSLTGTFNFVAPNEDVDTLGIEITAPNGERGELPRSELAGVYGLDGGEIQFGLFLQPQLEGQHAFDIFVVDARDNESNRLSGTFDVEPASASAPAPSMIIEPIIIEAIGID